MGKLTQRINKLTTKSVGSSTEPTISELIQYINGNIVYQDTEILQESDKTTQQKDKYPSILIPIIRRKLPNGKIDNKSTKS